LSASGFRLLFAGTPAFAARALERVLSSGFEVAAVLTRPDKAAGRGLKLHESPVKELALAHGLPVLQPATLRTPEGQRQLFEHPADVMVVAAYGLILPQPALDFPRHGCINIHASLLPRWRGAAPIQRALLAGDPKTGVSIMQMDAGLDTGPVLREAVVPIAASDTAGTLHDKLAALGAEELLPVLAALRSGSPLRPQPQRSEGATYASKVEPAEARIDWNAPAETIERQVRAFDPHPGAWTRLRDTTAKVWRAELASGSGAAGTILAADAGGIVVACGRGALRILEVQRAGSRRLGAAAFLAGCRLAPGESLRNAT
jgi:methionyl-tRNA formyltransferase